MASKRPLQRTTVVLFDGDEQVVVKPFAERGEVAEPRPPACLLQRADNMLWVREVAEGVNDSRNPLHHSGPPVV